MRALGLILYLVGLFATPAPQDSQLSLTGQNTTLRERAYTAAKPKAKYYGGPLIGTVKVFLIYWGGKTKITDYGKLEPFYKQLVSSPYLDWLKEYNTPDTKFTKGSYSGSYDYSTGLKGSITDDQIRIGLKTLFDNKIIKPTSNTYFAIHFAPGIFITQSEGVSCVDYCAYHSSFAYEKMKVLYGIIPSFKGTGCAKGCGGSPKEFDNVCATASHELVETMTDPLIAEATSNGYPLGWYDPIYGEIGDYCNQQQQMLSWSSGGKKFSIIVQPIWSNARGKCVSQ